eukprot:TRINITY_DN12851_c0_g1_i1.p1 TRINITY_DN12851_c0_g1~~TRINITY_DN12851_c0_g1_i1.p1  ORF type:complete len:1713 (+),score=451.79 TRINITY_DN12851_c0_g1_i1:76-5214(+)
MALPIQFKELFNLQTMGINPQFLTFNSVAMESEKFITVREEVSGTVNVIIVDVAARNLSKRPMSADAVLMNPKAQVLALRARDKATGHDQLQVFNLEMKSKLKSFTMTDQVVFWRWISANTLALVTATKVLHWSMDDASDPVPIFARHDSLNAAQIINYRVEPDGKWAVLVGIARTPDNRIGGLMQLYSIEKKQSQPIEGHAAGFLKMTVQGASRPSTLFCFAVRNATGAKLHVVEVGSDAPVFQKKAVDITFPPDAATDFPVGLQVSDKYGVAYVVTQQGFIHMYDVESGTCLFRNRISKETIFLSCAQDSNGGILAVARTGQLLSITVDDEHVVPYIQGTLGNAELAFRFAARNNLGGAESVFKDQFARFFQGMQYKEAAGVAASSPQQFLRTSETIERFKQAPAAPGQPPPILQYFGVLLEQGTLNKSESVELVRYVLGIGRKNLIEKWLQEEKLECSEELGDLIKPQDPMLALSVYLRANAPAKVIVCFAESGQYPNIIVYAKKVGYQPDYVFLLNNIMRINQAAGLEFAQKLLQDENGPLADVKQIVDCFVQRNMVQEATSLLLDVLKPNRPEDADLQTLLLEINLMAAPQVADLILSKEMFSHYNKTRIAALCEKAGLGQRALEHYTELADIKRVISQQGHIINPEWLTNYFGTLSVEYTLDAIKELLQQRTRHGLQIAIQVATRYSDQLTPAALIALFESFNNFEGLFFYLHGIVTTTEDPDIVFKYIQSASKAGRLEEVKRVCRENNVFDAAKVKDFLMEAKLPDQIPLIIVCDRFDFVDELTHYLYKNNMLNKIEVYVQKVNPLRTPMVVGALLDSDCEESFIKNLIMSVRNMCSVEELVDQVEKRHRLKLLQPWLEARIAEGNQDPAAHNALAKIIVDANNDPEHFLQTNQFYDSLIVGKYCEKVDPHLAYVAYKRGQCDNELVEITNKSGLFKQQARYLVERQSPELWAAVLDEANKSRRSVIDQVVSTALPECKSADQVSATVKAFMTAGLPNELIELLEKIVLEQSDFSGNKNLQNLLILTAIKADQSRVMEYINRLDNYDGPDIATIAISAGLYEEAFTIYKKFNLVVPAVQVLLNNIHDLERAFEFAERTNEPDVWSNLAGAQLEADMITEGIDSYIKAKDASQYKTVIYRAENAEKFEDLVRYLQMARLKIKDSEIDSELVFAFAKVNNMSGVEDFINNPNVANLQAVGDRCFVASLFEAARILFDFIQNYARLASTYVRLERYQQAVEAARKANKTNTWKEINAACVEVREFRLAQQCAQHIIVQPDELDELVRFYEVRGYFDEIISVLEQGSSHERAHTGLFTQLGICYSKYRPAKLMEHLKMFIQRVSIPRLIRICETNLQWAELTFLYKNYNEFDNAALCMIDHPVEAWDDIEFKDTIVKVSNTDIYYKAINFYMNEQGYDKLNQLLGALAPKIDHIRVVQVIRKANNLPMIKPYLKSVQNLNISQVNEALNELFIEEEDYESLQQSIDTFNQFDNLSLARTCEKNELIKFRQIAASLYSKNKRYQQSVELSKQDKLWQSAMETAAESKDQDIAENLVRFFIDQDLPECFAAALFTCYDLLRPDVILELGWRKGIIDYAMPYLVQMVREYTGKIDGVISQLAKEKEERKKKEESAAAEQEAGAVVYDNVAGMPVDGGMGGFMAPQSMVYPPQSGYVVGVDPQTAMQMAAMSGYPPSVMPGMSMGMPGGYGFQ